MPMESFESPCDADPIWIASFLPERIEGTGGTSGCQWDAKAVLLVVGVITEFDGSDWKCFDVSPGEW